MRLFRLVNRNDVTYCQARPFDPWKTSHALTAKPA